MTDPKTDPKPDVKPATDTKSAAAKPSTGAKVDMYRVTAPYVTLKLRSDMGGTVVRGFFEGAVLPDTVDLEDLARHIRKGMVEKLVGEDATAAQRQQDSADKAAAAAAAPEDKAGVQAVKDAEAARQATLDAEAKEDAEAKKEGRVRMKATDSPRSTTTAVKG